MKKLILLIISLFIFMMPLNAVSKSEVNYKIEDMIVDARIDISSNVLVKEVIGVKGTFNGYIRDLVYKNSNIKKFTNKDSDFEGSDIYNAKSITINKVGKVKVKDKLDFTIFDQEIEEFSECNDSKLCYEKNDINDGVSIKMYNETKSDITYFYIEYLLGNTVVIHNDIAELYYNFVGENFDDEIKNYQLRVVLPSETKEEVKVWAHGPLNGEVYLLSEGEDKDIKYAGGYLKIENLEANTPVDIRMTFDKSLILVDHPFLTKTNVDALDKILKVEEKRANDANSLRKTARVKVYGTYVFTGLYLLITLILIIYVYLKYDKEVKTEITSEYNREFIDDYDVTVIEYLFDKKITEKAFSTSILNLIYKKKIKVEEVNDKKKDYKLIKINTEGLTTAENKVMDILFNEAGNTNEVTLKQLKNYAKNINGTVSPFLNSYNEWNTIVKNDSIKEDFYENNTKIKVWFILYSLIVGTIILYLHSKFNMIGILSFIVFIVTFIFIIYLAVFTKRTNKGAVHFNKWKAFKKFLNDFGRFEEKELPEIALWERYLVYANIFGIADKVSKTMKLKFKEMNMSTDSDIFYRYMLYDTINSNINHTVHQSVQTARSAVSEAVARSTNSSGSGFGGGFSSGGGFGGGGGGGRGF